jgi:DNA-binding MarR family transcriptional regulator
MQSLRSASNLSSDSYVCAQELLDVVPLVMRVIRKHMRRHRSGLTVPQFRTLCYVSSTPNSSLSDVADFIGLSLPAMSRLVDGMVDDGLMGRRTCADDRRHIRLSVTPEGEAALTGARRLAQERLADVVGQLPADQQQELTDTLRMVREIFTPESLAVQGDGRLDD